MKAIKDIKVMGYGLQVTGYRLWVMVLLAVLPIVASAVEYKNMYQPTGYDRQRTTMLAEAPTAVFHSTSTLAGSGSAWSATPMLNADGTAYDPSVSPRGPRRMRMDDDEDEPAVIETPTGKQPLGDAVLPLLLLACAYLCTRVFRKKRAMRG